MVYKDNHYLDTLCGHVGMVHWQWAPSFENLAKRKARKEVHAENDIKSPIFTGSGLFGG